MINDRLTPLLPLHRHLHLNLCLSRTRSIIQFPLFRFRCMAINFSHKKPTFRPGSRMTYMENERESRVVIRNKFYHRHALPSVIMNSERVCACGALSFHSIFTIRFSHSPSTNLSIQFHSSRGIVA